MARRARSLFIALVALLASSAAGLITPRLPAVRVSPSIRRIRPAQLVDSATEDAAEPISYGEDPREQFGSSGDERWEGPPAAGTLGSITSIRELSSAVESAEADSKFVVIKFFAPWCTSCKAIEARFSRAAKAQGADANFYVIDFSKSKALCKACGIKFMPVAHIYAGGALQEAMPIGAKAFPGFVKRMTAVHGELSGSSSDSADDLGPA